MYLGNAIMYLGTHECSSTLHKSSLVYLGNTNMHTNCPAFPTSLHECRSQHDHLLQALPDRVHMYVHVTTVLLTSSTGQEVCLLTAVPFTSFIHCRNPHKIHRPRDQIPHFIAGGDQAVLHRVQHVYKPPHFPGGFTSDGNVEPFHWLARGCKAIPLNS